VAGRSSEARGGAGAKERVWLVVPGEHSGEELGGERREQDAVAVVPGGPGQPVERAAADRGSVVGRGGAKADAELLDLELADAGQELASVAQQLVDTAGARQRIVEAALLDGRAEQIAPVAARDEIAALEAQHATQQTGAGGVAQAQDLALDGPHGHARGGGETGDPAGPGTSGEHDLAGRQRLAVGEGDAADALAVELDARDWRVLAQAHAGGDAGAPQRAQHEARVDGVVVGRVQREAYGGRERGLALARGAGAQALDGQPQRFAVGQLALELARVVVVAGEQQRAAAQQADVDLGGVGDLGGERGPHGGGAQPELEQAAGGVSELDLGDGREHAGGDARGRTSDLVALEQRDRQAALARTPGDGQSDDAAADDERVWSLIAGHAVDASPRPHARLRPMASSDTGPERRARLVDARLYLVCGAESPGGELPGLVRGAIAGGVDIVQLREKRLPDDELASVAHAARVLCERLGALLIVNDRPWAALEAGADGVHVGQDDIGVAEVREIVGPDMLIGLSTHAPEEIDAARPSAEDGMPLVDYIGVGPVHETPTKPGRPAVGVELVRYAAAHAAVPFFAIGGIDATNVEDVVAAGATRVCVLRAIAAAEDPERAARELRERLDAEAVN
jgi:thiamine-phosphate pyrophosphorylase